MAYWTLAGHRISSYDNTHTLPALGGEDCNREPGRLEISIETVNDRQLAVVSSDGFPLGLPQVQGETEIKGWGELDGPAYEIGGDEAAWTMSVPKALWDAFRARFADAF